MVAEKIVRDDRSVYMHSVHLEGHIQPMPIQIRLRGTWQGLRLSVCLQNVL